MILEKNVEKIISALQERGYEAYAVGGCVRDSVIGKVPHDWDITTSATPEHVRETFGKTIGTGLKHGTVTVMLGGNSYEVTTFRIDGKYSDGRRPESVVFTTSLKEDLRRRDFTINAMAYNPSTGIIDPFGGMDDLKSGIIRAVGNPVDRFSEDALRIMRAFRFSAQFGFSIEPETLKAAAMLAGNLRLISAERISAELDKILMSDHPEVLLDMYCTGVTKVFLPEFDACMETPQNNVHHAYDVGTHTVMAVRNVRKDRVLRNAALMHDFGKPVVKTTDEKGVDHFFGHPEKSAEIAVQVMKRLRYDNRTMRAVETLVKWHELQIRKTMPGIRKVAAEIGIDALENILELRVADITAQSMYQREEKLADTANVKIKVHSIVENGDCLSLKDLAVNGEDLLAAGLVGKEIGEALSVMLTEVINCPEHNNRDYLIERFIKKEEK